MAKGREVQVDLVQIVELLQTHITPALCRAVFRRVRNTERQRKWTLHALVSFWIAVVLRAPKALTQALVDAGEGREPLFPGVDASEEAFFQRCRDLRPEFFGQVFREFTGRLLTASPPRYASDVAPVQARFAAVVALDGSRLAAIARRLKLLWNERSVILPGCLLAVYDLGRGLCRSLAFSADAAAGEWTRAKDSLAELPTDTLVLGDRLYCTAAFFNTLGERGCWGLVRRNSRLSLHRLQRRRKCRYQGGVLEDWVVRAGTGASAAAVTLRYIRWRRGGTRHELLTSVLDGSRLRAEEALALYARRWSIERMYFDLKVVLNLNRVYAANPNAVALQVYAAAMVYNAFRVAQSEAAAAGGIAPEEISPAKFYPRLAVACFLHLLEQQWEQGWRRHHCACDCHIKRRPARSRRSALSTLRREQRTGTRRRRRFCPARRKWKSLAHVRGGRRLLQLS